MHVHQNGTQCCRLIPSCMECNREGGQLVAAGKWRPSGSTAPLDIPQERDGLAPDDRRWDVPWLAELRNVPADATWPRLMTVPHPRARASLGDEFAGWAKERTGRPLRWWQRLVAMRLLETDSDGALLWETLVLTMARQLGKSWLLRELCLWRIHQGERFGEPQDVLHTGKDLAVCKEVQRSARIWAKARGDRYRVREVNGQEEIEVLADGSRWMLRAKEAVYGYSVSGAAADEAWKVKAHSIEEGLTPTMTEREQAQLWLVSTAHRMATSLMLSRRTLALSELESGAGDLLIEWSAQRAAELDSADVWRMASPHWTARRERLIGQRLEAARSGELEDPDEPDPIESFRAQWLNQWPARKVEPPGANEDLLPEGTWQALAEEIEPSLASLFVSVEDDRGLGAAVAAVAVMEDGRMEVDGWRADDWDDALRDVQRLAALREIRGFRVGPSLIDRATELGFAIPPADVATLAETRIGLALFRDLATSGQLVHDHTTEDLDEAVSLAQVRESPSGLHLVARGHSHLIKAMVWALAMAHRPAFVPAIF